VLCQGAKKERENYIDHICGCTVVKGDNNNRELRDAVGIVCQQAVHIMNGRCANCTSCSVSDSLGFKLNSV